MRGRVWLRRAGWGYLAALHVGLAWIAAQILFRPWATDLVWGPTLRAQDYGARTVHQARRATQLAGGLAVLGDSIVEDMAVGALHPGAENFGMGGDTVAFDLPWPWAGERFEIRDIRPLTYITGPLGSGKTRLAQRLAETLPGAAFLGLDRAPIETGPALEARVERALARLVEDGATASPALAALLRGLEAKGPQALVVDLVEQGLDRASQEALIARLRRRGRETRPLFVMTRSTAILDLDAVGPYEAILYCPANHAVPMGVVPCPGAAGYEALASCLASPEVRARSEGVIAWRS